MGCLKLTYRSGSSHLKVVKGKSNISVKSYAGVYGYGFGAMEKDDEWKGAGNSYTTEFRINDPRLGKWLSIDPLAHKFPWQSPYVSMDNNPIALTDPFGLSATKYEDESGNAIVPETNDGSDDVVTITDDKMKGFMASYTGTSAEARNSTGMNNTWKRYASSNNGRASEGSQDNGGFYFSEGGSPFKVHEKTPIAGGEIIVGSYGSISVSGTGSAPRQLQTQSISSKGFALGYGLGLPLELFSTVKGQIYFTQPTYGRNLREIFNNTAIIVTESAGSIFYKYSYIQGQDINGNTLWYSHSKGTSLGTGAGGDRYSVTF